MKELAQSDLVRFSARPGSWSSCKEATLSQCSHFQHPNLIRRIALRRGVAMGFRKNGFPAYPRISLHSRAFHAHITANSHLNHDKFHTRVVSSLHTAMSRCSIRASQAGQPGSSQPSVTRRSHPGGGLGEWTISPYKIPKPQIRSLFLFFSSSIITTPLTQKVPPRPHHEKAQGGGHTLPR